MAQGKQTVTNQEIKDVMTESSDPAFTTSEIAAQFGLSVEGMRGRLEELAEKGEVLKKKPGPRTVLWWVREDQRD